MSLQSEKRLQMTLEIQHKLNEDSPGKLMTVTTLNIYIIAKLCLDTFKSGFSEAIHNSVPPML